MTTLLPIKARLLILCLLAASCFLATQVFADAPLNIVKNPDFSRRSADGNSPAFYDLTGNVEYRYMGNPTREMSGWGVALQAGRYLQGNTMLAGSVSQKITGIDSKAGRWFRFTFRGLPQDNFEVTEDDLKMKVAFFGDSSRTAYDSKAKYLYEIIQQARRDLSVNGVRHIGGAAVWRDYVMDLAPLPAGG